MDALGERLLDRTYYRDGSIKQYVRDHLLLRTEATAHNVRDFGVPKAIEMVPQVREALSTVTDRYLTPTRHPGNLPQSRATAAAGHAHAADKWETDPRLETRSPASLGSHVGNHLNTRKSGQRRKAMSGAIRAP